MAKGNMFLGLARGSVGDVTFYRRNAQQISRVRVRKVKNPQTSAQMWQRAINTTAVQAYSVLKSICDHSYEGIAYGAPSYSKFLSLNMDMLRQEAAKPSTDNYGQRAYCPFGFLGISAMPYIVSRGTVQGADASFHKEGTYYEGVKVGTMPESVTIQNFTYQMLANMLHAQQGDQITILRVPNPAVAGYVDEPLGRNLLLARVILDPAEGSFESTAAFSQSSGGFVMNSPNIRNEGIFIASTGGSGGADLILSAGALEVENVGFAVITSRQQPDGSWLRSNSVFLYNPLYRENGYTIKQASTMTPVDLYVENEKYLNNAE